jgi:hypothetical protein
VFPPRDLQAHTIPVFFHRAGEAVRRTWAVRGERNPFIPCGIDRNGREVCLRIDPEEEGHQRPVTVAHPKSHHGERAGEAGEVTLHQGKSDLHA